MAKGNLFLGTASKSVGDVVMFRREGTQVSRVRVRDVKNPKTTAQARQRAIMAAVVKFYQPLADVLERSWQGLSTAKSYAKFLQVNANIGRNSSFTTNTDITVKPYVIAKGASAIPYPYNISNGTLPVPQFEILQGDSAWELIFNNETLDNPLTPSSTLGDFSTYLITHGYKDGDVLTFIGVGVDGTYAAGYQTAFSSFQITLDTSSTVVLSTLSNFNFSFEQLQGELVLQYSGAGDLAAGGFIASRPNDDSFIRTTSYMVVIRSWADGFFTTTMADSAIATYTAAGADANPLVYLDGDDNV